MTLAFVLGGVCHAEGFHNLSATFFDFLLVHFFQVLEYHAVAHRGRAHRALIKGRVHIFLVLLEGTPPFEILLAVGAPLVTGPSSNLRFRWRSSYLRYPEGRTSGIRMHVYGLVGRRALWRWEVDCADTAAIGYTYRIRRRLDYHSSRGLRHDHHEGLPSS